MSVGVLSVGVMSSTTALEALQAIDALLSGINADGLRELGDRDLVAVMRTARKLKGRFDALACVATALVEDRKSSMKTVGTPTTSLIALDDGIDNRQAAGQIAQAKNATAHQSAKQAALDGEITCEHAAAITKGIDSLPHLPTDVVDKVADAFVQRAKDTSPRKLRAVGAQHPGRGRPRPRPIERRVGGQGSSSA